VLGSSILLTACGPRAHIPPVPIRIAAAVDSGDTGAILARALAPILYLQRDEWFPLERAVAVLHPARRLIAYHLLWRDDVHGSWIPFTVPPTRKSSGSDTTPRLRPPTSGPTGTARFCIQTGAIAANGIDVQWGKHGSLPRGVHRERSAAPEESQQLLRASRGSGCQISGWATSHGAGRFCFCHGYARYRDFSKPLFLSGRLDAVVRTEDAREALGAVFGKPYSKKPNWP
jgi:hypothetical protein